MTHHTRERNIIRLLKGTHQSEILFHHRFPTSTENVRNACHPFSTKNQWDNNYVGVHNGVIWNDYEVGKKQYEQGINYVSLQSNGSFNDSEVLIYDIAQFIEGEKEELECRGNIAFIMVQRNKAGEKVALYFGRNTGNPLKLKKFKDGFSLKSEGNGEDIKPNTLFRYDYKTKEFTEQPLEIPMYAKYKRSSSYRIDNGYSGSYGQTNSSSHGDYNGYENGYDWDGYAIESRTLKSEFSNTSASTLTHTTLDRYASHGKYGLTEETMLATQHQIESDIIEALRYDSYNTSDEWAMEIGEEILDELQSEYLELSEKLDRDEDFNGFELDLYIELENKINFLTRALSKLTQLHLQKSIKLGVDNLRLGV